MLARDKSATKPYTIGLTYRVAEVGLICRTTKVLETANRNGVVTDETALPLFPLWIEVFFGNKLGDSKPTDVSSRSCPRRVGGQWGEGLTAAEMAKCRWLKPRLIATIDYLERTATNHLRHPMFSGLQNSASKGSPVLVR